MVDAGIFDKESVGSSSMMGGSPWIELIGDDKYIKSQYDLIDGHFPENENQVVLIVDSNKQITDYILYSLGIKDTIVTGATVTSKAINYMLALAEEYISSLGGVKNG